MLKWWGGKSDHPLADPKETKKLLAELPAGDSFKALEEIVYWLESLGSAEDFRCDARLQAVDALDAAAKPHQRRLSQEYLSVQRLQKFQENRIWTAVCGFWTALGAAYGRCVQDYRAGIKGAGAMRGQLPAALAREVRATGLRLKWLLLRYEPVEERLWSDLGGLAGFAEQNGCLQDEIIIYPGQFGQGSIQRELLKPLLLWISAPGSLLPTQLEIAERVGAHLSGKATLAPEPGPDRPYCFDPASGRPPGRLPQGTEAPLGAWYFGAGAAAGELARLTEQVMRGRLPEDFNLGGSYDSEVILEVLRHLARHWQPTPPTRHHERRPAMARLSVAPGRGALLRQTDGGGDEEESVESWVVENVSDGGYGAFVSRVQGDWLKVGSLVGLRAETAPHWGVGIVRRMVRGKDGIRVGIESLSAVVLPVVLAAAGSRALARRAGEEGADGRSLLLSRTPDATGEILVALAPGNYNLVQGLEMTVGEKRYGVVPTKLLESGDDYDLAKFRVVKKLGGEG